MSNLELVEAELENAKRKHPHFIDHMCRNQRYHDPKQSTEIDLKDRREVLAAMVCYENVDFECVLKCEVMEALHAYAHGELAHARQELAQCAAVCIRGMEYIEAEMEKGGKHEDA